MKIARVNLEWYAIRYDSNKKSIVQYNILGGNFKDILAKEIRKKKITNFKELKEYLRKEFMYYYWSKCEHEIAVWNLFDINQERAEKIDIYYQLKPNLDRIAEYINNTMDLKLK